MIDLTGQKALITGGTRGIGKAIATALAVHGCDVALNYLRKRDVAANTADQIETLTGRRPLLLKGNVAEPEGVAEMFSELQAEWDGLDILVSNAASGVHDTIDKLTRKHWQWTLDINAGALLWLTQQAMPMMAGRGGRIVATSSLGSIRAFENYLLVGASKGALESMVRHLCRELAPKGIRCNIVNAGVVETEALDHFKNKDEMLAAAAAATPAGRMVTPEDVANAVLFLVSDYASMVHGQSIIVDGGASIVG